MKKYIKIAALVLVVGLLVSVVVVYLLLGRALKGAVETVGPRATKTPVKVSSASLSPFTGSGGLSGLVIGNPSGFKTSCAVNADDISVCVRGNTLFSDPLIIESIRIDKPVVTYEMGPTGSNIDVIKANVETFCGKSDSTRKVIIRDFVLTGGTVRVSAAMLGGNAVPMPIGDIHLTGIGEKSNGILVSDAIAEIVKPLGHNLSSVGGSMGGAIQTIGTKAMKDGVKGIFGK